MALNTLHGSCACKAILYEAVKLSTPIQHCHCQTCRKTHAAAFAPTAGILPADFTRTQDISALLAAAIYWQKAGHSGY